MADVRFDRAQGALVYGRIAGAKSFGQAGNFDGIAQGGAGSVGLDVADSARVDAMRFPEADTAEVRYTILMNGSPTGFAFQGSAKRRDGKWRVTRETIALVLASVGVTVPPRRA